MKQKNHLIYITGIKVSKILLQFVLFYDTLTVYAENKRKRQILQILVFTGVGLLCSNVETILSQTYIVSGLLSFEHHSVPLFYLKRY